MPSKFTEMNLNELWALTVCIFMHFIVNYSPIFSGQLTVYEMCIVKLKVGKAPLLPGNRLHHLDPNTDSTIQGHIPTPSVNHERVGANHYKSRLSCSLQGNSIHQLTQRLCTAGRHSCYSAVKFKTTERSTRVH